MSTYYCGVGSRKCPKDICDIMTEIASWHESKGFILRSGGALGADTAFELGVKDSSKKQIFLASDPISKEAIDLAFKFHPMGNNLRYKGDYVVKLMARNGYQVLGPDLKTPSKYVVCWTPNADSSGGTGQAIRIARAYNIPVYDLGDPDILSRVLKQIQK
jgi:hypothetical protein